MIIEKEKKNIHWTGIGSRETPIEICNLMTQIASKLEQNSNFNYILRSGRAIFEILKRNNRITVENITKMYKIISKKEILSERERVILEIEEMPEKEEIPFSNTVPPHNVHYGYPL